METLEMGAPGTSRWIRMVKLRGVSQAEMGRLCRPKLPQASISQFDRAEHRMSWSMARRLAPAYAAEKAEKNLDDGAIEVWQIWFVNVDAYGTPDMKRQANSIRESFGFDLPLLKATHAQSAKAVEQLAQPALQEARLA